MAWLWSSWQEFIDVVQPCEFDSRGVFNLAHRRTWFEVEQQLAKTVRQIEDALAALHQLGFTGGDRKPQVPDQEVVDEAYIHVADLIDAGERLLLYHKRLAKSKAVYGFLHQHELSANWKRYETRHLFQEVDQLIKDTGDLLSGYYDMIEADDGFLIGVLELPDYLEADFRLARNLFSVGFDEVGVLIAGRGLEGVLRKIAEVRKISIDIRGKVVPAFDADFYDLIEAFYHIRWKVTGIRLISSETKALLHYLRTLRNASAHAGIISSRPVISPRETAAVIADAATQLWKGVSSTRARLNPTTIPKSW